MSNKLDQSKREEIIHRITQIASLTTASLDPTAGLASAIVLTFIKAPFERRVKAWMKDVSNHLLVMWDKIIEAQPESLVENEVFISTLQQAAIVAGKNHQKDKLDALRNAVLNSALPRSIDDDLQLMFIGFIEELTVSHMKILKELIGNNFTVDQESTYSDFLKIMFVKFPEMEKNPEFFELIGKQLVDKKLISAKKGQNLATFEADYGFKEEIDTASVTVASRLTIIRTTQTGREFLKFITCPFDFNN